MRFFHRFEGNSFYRFVRVSAVFYVMFGEAGDDVWIAGRAAGCQTIKSVFRMIVRVSVILLCGMNGERYWEEEQYTVLPISNDIPPSPHEMNKVFNLLQMKDADRNIDFLNYPKTSIYY